MKKGKFIVFEGGEGSGKDTQIELLKKEFPQFLYTREPGGTELGEKIRSLVLSKDSSAMSVKTELLLFLSARAQLLEEVIIPALEKGETVISNRFGLSTLAYQIYGRERLEYLDFLKSVNEFVVGEYTPDLYIFLDINPEEGLKRVAARKDENTRFDDEKLQFHLRTYEGYKKGLDTVRRSEVVDANKPIEEVYKDIKEIITNI